MGPQPTRITVRAKAMVWVAVVVGAAASLAQLLLEWRFDLLAARLVDAHNDTLLRSGVTDSVIVWSPAPTVYYAARLALWLCAAAATVVSAAMAVRSRRGGHTALLVLAALFTVANLAFARIYGGFITMRVNEVYGGEIAYPRGMYVMSAGAAALAAVVAAVVAAALVVVCVRPPFARPRNPVKLGLREGE